MKTKVISSCEYLTKNITVLNKSYTLIPYISDENDFLCIPCGEKIYCPIRNHLEQQDFFQIIESIKTRPANYFKSEEELFHFINHILFKLRIEKTEKAVNHQLKEIISQIKNDLGIDLPITTHRRNSKNKVHLKVKIFIPTNFSSESMDKPEVHDLCIDPTNHNKHTAKKHILIATHYIPKSFSNKKHGIYGSPFKVRLVISDNLDGYIKYNLHLLVNRANWYISTALFNLTGDHQVFLKYFVDSLLYIIKNKSVEN